VLAHDAHISKIEMWGTRILAGEVGECGSRITRIPGLRKGTKAAVPELVAGLGFGFHPELTDGHKHDEQDAA
jgi:hypothetical protein